MVLNIIQVTTFNNINVYIQLISYERGYRETNFHDI